MSTGIKSAIKSLQIISHDDSLLGKETLFMIRNCRSNQLPDVFLPFDLEFTYGAGLHLIMASALFPSVADDQDYSRMAYTTLDEMIQQGNKIAEVRKAELIYLERLCQELASQSEQHDLQTLSLTGPDGSETDTDTHMLTQPDHTATMPSAADVSIGPPAPMPGQPVAPGPDFRPPMSNIEFLDDIGISSENFFSIVDQMGDQDIFPNVLMDHQLNQPFHLL